MRDEAEVRERLQAIEALRAGTEAAARVLGLEEHRDKVYIPRYTEQDLLIAAEEALEWVLEEE